MGPECCETEEYIIPNDELDCYFLECSELFQQDIQKWAIEEIKKERPKPD